MNPQQRGAPADRRSDTHHVLEQRNTTAKTAQAQPRPAEQDRTGEHVEKIEVEYIHTLACVY
eukprot:scaffold3826_cov78-Phaeocystis_antarctica.AAC.2